MKMPEGWLYLKDACEGRNKTPDCDVSEMNRALNLMRDMAKVIDNGVKGYLKGDQDESMNDMIRILKKFRSWD